MQGVLDESIVVVSGLPRSGTSMMMAVLRAGGLGIVADDARVADENNPNGYFEDERIKALANKTDRAWLVQARGKAIKVVTPLLCHLPSTQKCEVIVMRRDLQEVLLSQTEMLLRRGQSPGPSDETMRRIFTEELKKADLFIEQAEQIRSIDVEYGQMFAEPTLACRRVADFLGRNLNIDNMTSVVNPALYRTRCAPIKRE